MPKAEFKRGEGPDALPQGEATALNEAPVPAAPAEVVAEPEIQLAQPSDYEPDFAAESEDDDFITGPTLKPGEPVTAGTERRRMDPDVKAHLGALQRAAQGPGASKELVGLVNLLLRDEARR